MRGKEQESLTSFEDVYKDNFRYVYNFIYMKVLHKEAAEDLTSETFTSALKSWDKYDPEIASVRTWLCSIALHAVGMQNRKASTQREVATDTIPETPSEDSIDVSVFAINREAERILSNLNDDERYLVSLRLNAELSFKEIAQVLDTNEKAAAERYRRVIIKCRKFTEGRSMDDFI
ncbi:RNA polymerase sigma factor [Butyrivibrio sp. WCD3002]|uniref:RNA polymerase sigma factor n=1 Tax=Butyrivibrio sp. WCD3002 TaxID=1280676 RepID=UPI000400E455|nr:sigma-70 family RNA polymerase sigma factor [Butyrivibrio sp. WCD3002]